MTTAQTKKVITTMRMITAEEPKVPEALQQIANKQLIDKKKELISSFFIYLTIFFYVF
jgi:hypothetical protein